MSVLRRAVSLLHPRDRGLQVARRAAVALALAASLAAWKTEPVGAQQEDGSRVTTRAEPDGAPVAVEETLGKIDVLLVQLDARTKDAWARAEEMLDLADAATDPDEQMRLEALYGKMAAVANGFEEQRARLRALRSELAVVRDRMPP